MIFTYVQTSQKRYADSAGFSLVETLVAITLLLLVMVGPLAITSRTASSATFASEQVVATFLAQEGLEIAQKAREDLVLNSTAFDGTRATAWADFVSTSGVYGPCVSSSGCRLELDSLGAVVPPQSCATIANCQLYLNTATGTRSMYTHTGTNATTTPYTRTIKITAVPGSPDEVKVESIVTWRTGSLVSNQRVRLESALVNVYGL